MAGDGVGEIPDGGTSLDRAKRLHNSGISPTPSPPLTYSFLFGNHRFVFCVCDSLSVLEISAFVFYILDSKNKRYHMIFVFVWNVSHLKRSINTIRFAIVIYPIAFWKNKWVYILSILWTLRSLWIKHSLNTFTYTECMYTDYILYREK